MKTAQQRYDSNRPFDEPTLYTHLWVRERALRALVALEESDTDTLHEILDGLATYEPRDGFTH